jgi:hypothetical protein
MRPAHKYCQNFIDARAIGANNAAIAHTERSPWARAHRQHHSLQNG